MDPKLYTAAISGDVHVLVENKLKLEDEITNTNNTVLHLASQLGHADCVAEILIMAPSLLLKQNSRDETPLHLAAWNGHANVCIQLIHSARNAPEPAVIESGVGVGGGGVVKEMLWMQNKEKDTALHLAARNNFHQVVGLLTKEDPVHQPHPSNILGETPLYLAASRGHSLVVAEILDNCESPAYNGPKGATALHAAMISKSSECVVKLLGWDTSLTRTTDVAGQTPLHYAALVGYSRTVEELMLVDKSCAYIQDEVGKNTAFYLAASRGHSIVMERMASFCPDLWDMVNGEKLRNTLHVAVDQNRRFTVEFILEKCPVISSVINQKDVDGNTPCHLIATSFCFVPMLLNHPLVDKRALNNKRLTALDLVKSADRDPEVAGEKRRLVRAMRRAGASWSFHNSIGNNEDNERNPYCRRNKDHATKVTTMKKMGDTHMIVAALVATVTFAAAITMPGGYNGDKGPGLGLAVLKKDIAFNIFVVSDSLALVLSLSAISIYIAAATWGRVRVLKVYYYSAGVLLYCSLLAMLIAFFAGIYATTTASSHHPVVLIVGSFLICVTFHRVLFRYLVSLFKLKRSHNSLYKYSSLV